MNLTKDGQHNSTTQQSWYCVHLGAADIARNWHGILLSRFETFFRALNGPVDMAMFTTAMADDGATLYFTPATAARAPAFIRLANAGVCDMPTVVVMRLAGHPAIEQRLGLNR
jgi:hypothetical protein